MHPRRPLLALACCLTLAPLAHAADSTEHTRKADVVYGRKFGMALTMDVFTPKQQNGAALVYVVSGGWYSSRDSINLGFIEPFLKRGYTVFAVMHGSQPKFTIPEAVEDMSRSVRFIRHNAREFGIDPNRIGVYGGSAGGHLSLMMGTAGAPEEPKAKDPVDRESSRVQAVACFFPPTDFLNYGKSGEHAIGRGVLEGFKAPFDFHTFDGKAGRFVPVVDDAEILNIARFISPINHVTPDDPPTLIIHGDADKLVPIQQGALVIDRLKTLGVDARLVTKPGAAHGWAGLDKDIETLADWFDAELKPAAKKAG